MEKKRLTDKDMSKELGGIIDEVVVQGKKAVRSLFDLMVERTAQTANDIVDKRVDGLKQKINESDTDETK